MSDNERVCDGLDIKVMMDKVKMDKVKMDKVKMDKVIIRKDDGCDNENANNGNEETHVVTHKVKHNHNSHNGVVSNASDADVMVNIVVKSMLHSSRLISSSSPNTFPRLYDEQKRPFILQPSLFPFVPPSIYFILEQETISPIPDQLKKYLKWKLSSITPNTIKSTVLRSGYQLIKDKNNRNKWSATWRKHMKSNEFKCVLEFQKVNHFPGSYYLGRKDKLWTNLKEMSEKHGSDVFGEFHPQTFILPFDLKLLKKYWISCDDQVRFIMKPPASARGQGISVINKYNQIPHAAKAKRIKSTKSTLIIQQYISNPCLLFNGTKFDLRVYVLITSVMPLRIYVYEDGLVRFASVKYSNSDDDLSDQFIHLTNYSVNKNSLTYVSNQDSNSHSGNKWTLKTLWKYLSQTCKGVDVELLWKNIIDLIIKTVISSEANIHKLVKQHLKNRYNSFELLGFDIMLDDKYKPWLLEVNISPSLKSDSTLDSTVKSSLIKDMFNLVGFQLPPNCGNGMCFNRSYYATRLTEEEKIKHQFCEELGNSDQLNEEMRDEMCDHLTGDDVRHLIELEDEYSRRGNFIRVFPSTTSDSHQYLQYFDYIFYYNILFDCWIKKYQHSREEGLHLLESLCANKHHIARNSQELTQNQLCSDSLLIDDSR